jgi:hypothetical protein
VRYPPMLVETGAASNGAVLAQTSDFDGIADA